MSSYRVVVDRFRTTGIRVAPHTGGGQSEAAWDVRAPLLARTRQSAVDCQTARVSTGRQLVDQRGRYVSSGVSFSGRGVMTANREMVKVL